MSESVISGSSTSKFRSTGGSWAALLFCFTESSASESTFTFSIDLCTSLSTQCLKMLTNSEITELGQGRSSFNSWQACFLKTVTTVFTGNL